MTVISMSRSLALSEDWPGLELLWRKEKRP
jgi:hypothetical protein